MFVEFEHPLYSAVELKGSTLILHTKQGETKILYEQVQAMAATLLGTTLHIVAFLNQTHALHFSGEEKLAQGRIELGQVYGGGGKLIADSAGNCHLFYFVQQSTGSSVLLKHQIFSSKWSNPVLVSTNMLADDTGFSAIWHSDNYLHLAYCTHRDRDLLYRVFSGEHKIWSGAVSFAEGTCKNPLFYSGEKLYLFWLEEGEKTRLCLRTKEAHWGQSLTVSPQPHDVTALGFALEQKTPFALWSAEGQLYQVPFDQWTEFQSVERSSYEYRWSLQNGLTLPIYRSQQPPEEPEKPIMEKPQPVVENASAPEAERQEAIEMEQRRKEESRAQAAFMEAAFRTLQEWESVKAELKAWQAKFEPPKPVDLTPLASRFDTLERRLFKLQQEQRTLQTEWEKQIQLVQRRLPAIDSRLTVLEEREKNNKVSLFRRVLRRL